MHAAIEKTFGIDLPALTPHQRYKLMAALIVPRPIALITTCDAQGLVNAAPFSLFNMVGEDPPLLMFSVNKREGGAQKDTARNVMRNGECVVHIGDETLTQALHDCSYAFAPQISELEQAGLSQRPSQKISVPGIAEAPVAFECVLHETLESNSRFVFFGRIVWLHVKQGLVDSQSWRVDVARHAPPGRMGANLYVKTRDTFSVRSRFGETA